MLKTVNRVLLTLAGLVLLAIGGAVLAAGLHLAVPSWWPWSGPHDVLLSTERRTKWRGDSWWWPAVIAAFAVIVLLALWWLLAQLRRSRLSEVLVDSGDGDGARLRGRALENVLAAEAESLHGVDSAMVRLTGRRTSPAARIGMSLAPHSEPVSALSDLTTGALAHARESAGLAGLPAEVQLRTVKHRARRVT
ncbi:alkaline shock response membrane anchor protein AmaP [Streptomyces sp. NBC_01180]|uniref:alkaline shock response membrane anchor protein AmaP n=1 Tax=Streptomyces sp. NBC_01180 TaxID=2903763 RepID=UPI0038653ABD|nr:alkaline shock response membrane anchor protein AmaP [Streptomyces sp. NBC_01180]